MSSEYGKGLVICLVKFAEHFMKLHSKIELYKRMNKKNPKLFEESDAISMWANEASDHLYEIEVPKHEGWESIIEKVGLLKDKGLEMRHGFIKEKNYTKEDAQELMNLTREIALMIDTKLGLSPDIGEW